MRLFIRYDTEYNRVIPAVTIDSRSTIPAIKTASGNDVKVYFDDIVANVKSRKLLPYKLETVDGNLIGYFAISVTNNVGNLEYSCIRPQFQNTSSQIMTEVNNFITSKRWTCDIIF